MTVVVRSGRIQAVARFGLIAENHNVRVINAVGKYIMPGLWDMDVHTAGSSAAWDEKITYPLYVANGVTSVRDMGCTAPDWRDLALSGHITFPKPLGRGCLSTDPSVVHLHVIRNFL